MSFQHQLIQHIKNSDPSQVYNMWDTKSSEFDPDNVKTFLAFLSSEKDLDVVKKYFTQIMAIYDTKVSENLWSYDIQLYSLIIRMYCMIGEYTIALEKFLELETGIKNGTIRKAISRKEMLKQQKKQQKQSACDSGDTEDEETIQLLKSISTRVIRPFFEMLPESNPEVLIGLFRNHRKLMKSYDYYNLLSKLLSYFNKHTTLPDQSQKDTCSDAINFLKSQTEKTNTLIESTVNHILKEFASRQEIIPKSLLDLIEKWFPDHHMMLMNKDKKSFNGQCLYCGNCLKPKFLSSVEKNMMVSQLIEAYPSTPQLDEFKNWLMQDRRCTRPTFIIDGGNVGYYSGTGEFSYWHISFMIKSLMETYSNYFKNCYNTLELPQIILIIHQRHLDTRKIVNQKTKKQIENHIKQWRDDALIWVTPPKCNDDIFLLMASFMIGESITVTNDQMRDHHLGKIDSNLFYRWKERHVASYQINPKQKDNRLVLDLPLHYSTGLQEITGSESLVSGWHIPVFKLPDDLQADLDKDPSSFPDPKYFPDPVKNHVELIVKQYDIDWYCLSKPI